MRERVALRRYALYMCVCVYVYKKERVRDRWVMANHREGGEFGAGRGGDGVGKRR